MTLAGRGIPVACRVLLAIAVGSAALFAAPEEAAAHTPHDVIGDVVASPAYATDRTAFVISADRLLRSTDGGSNWTQVVRGIDRPLAARLAIAPSDKATMYLSVRATAIYRSRDQGLSWQRNPTPTALRSIADFAVSPVSPDVMFAAGATNGLFRTSDGGASWTQVGTFGQVTTVLYPEQSGRVLIGDSNGSVFISDDDGATWVQSSGTISGDMVTAMSATLAPPSPGSIFVGTKSGKVLRSTNRGASYSVVGTGLPAEQVTSIAISKNYGTDSTVWVSTWNNMYRSTNRGASFALKNTGLTKDSQATGTGDPQFRGLEAAIGSNGRQVVFVAGFDGLFRSDDNGNQWRQIQTLGEFVTGLAVSPDYDDDATVISTTYVKGAYLSRDRGATWKGAQVGLGAPLATKFAPIHRLHNVHFSPNYANDGTIFTATWTDIVKTTDRAVTWTTIPVEPGSKVLRQFVIVVSPAYASDGTVYAGTQQGDIFRSTSRGEPNTWSLVANVGSMIRSIVISPDFANEPVMYASAVTGVFKSVDAGQTWQQRGPSGSSMLAMSPNYGTDGTVFAGTVNGLFVTRDEGQSWTELVEPPFTTTTNVAAVGVSPGSAAEQVVLVSVFGAGLFRSSDGGNSFSEVGRSLIESNHNIADFQNPTSAPIQFSPFFAQDHTVFGMAQQHLVKSTDAGDTWQVLNLPPAADILRPPTVAASPMTAQVVEGRSGTTRVMRIPFDLSHPYASTVTVQWQTVDVPNNPAYATSASGDYITASGTLTFSPGATRQFADVVVRGDSLDENDESVLLSLRNATNATIGGFLGLGSGVIQDDDPPPTVVPGSATVTERDADTAVVSIPLTLSAPSGRTATIDWSTLDYQAVGGEDFVAAAGTVTFQPGELTKTVDVTVSGDVLDEDDEVLLISTFNPVNAKVGGFWGLGVATIQDNDPLPAVALGSASVAEGDADSVTLSIPVTLSVPSGRMVSIDWTTVDDTAVGGEDFAPASGTLTFLPGEVTKTIDVTVFGDTTVEPDEALLVAASNPTNATLDGAAASGSGQILNDDQEPE